MDAKGATVENVEGNDPNSKVIVKGAQVLGYYGARKQRTSLSVQTKIEVIKYAEEHPSVTQNKIASHFGIDRTTVSKVLKRKDLFKAAKTDDVKCESSVPELDYATNNNTGVDSKSSQLDQNTMLTQAPRKSNRIIRPKAMLALPDSDEIRHNGFTYKVPERSSDLYEKCESWFMKQKFTTPSKRHQKDIIAYSCLISPLPLSIEDCDRIIPAKLVMDEGVRWLYEKIRSTDTSLRGMETFKGRGEELLASYIKEQLSPLNNKLQDLFKSCEYTLEDIRRIWKNYVGPKFKLFDDDINSDEELNGHFTIPPAKKAKLSVGKDSQELNIPLLPVHNIRSKRNTLPQQMFLVPTSQTTGHNVVQLAPAITSMTSPQPRVQFTPTSLIQSAFDTIPTITSAPSQPLLASALGLTNGYDDSENTALDLSTPTVEKGLDLSQKGESVRGSRKRKMNSNPVRIIASPDDDHETLLDTGDSHENCTDKATTNEKELNADKHPEITRCRDISNSEYKNMAKLQLAPTATDNLPVSTATGHPVIEIIPDSYRSKQCQSGLLQLTGSMKTPKHQNAAMNFCSRSDQMKTAGMHCDNAESLHDLSNNKSLSFSTIKGILKHMSLLAKEIKNLKVQVEHSKKKSSENSAVIERECSGNCNSKLSGRVSKLEDKLESMQEKLEKMYEAVMNKE